MVSRSGHWLGRGPSLGRQFLHRLLATALPRRLFVTSGPATSRHVCLTFDDGPHPEFTPALLDFLKSRMVRATFFVVGRQAEQYPELVRRMASEGHVIANHSYAHPRPGQRSAFQLMAEVARTDAYVESLLGIRPRLFRPPYGKTTPAQLWRLWRTGHSVVLWNVDPRDYARVESGEVRAWFDQRPLRGGDLVLLHDTCPHAIAVLPDLIEQARGSGLGFTTLSAWAGPAYFARAEGTLAPSRPTASAACEHGGYGFGQK